MAVITAYSTKKVATEAVKEIVDQLGSIYPKMVIYFASSEYDQSILAMEMKKPFPKASVFGCSTAGEITTGKMLEKSCVAMAFDSDSIEDCFLEIALDISKENSIRDVFETYKAHYKIQIEKVDPKEYVGLLLVDGLRKAEEKIMEIIRDLTNIRFVGGSAGDDMNFKETWVHYNGFVYTNAAIFALVKPKKGFDIIKTQSFQKIDKKLTATMVDETNRIVFKFNDIPAAKAYSDVLGIPQEELPEKFMSNPVGAIIDGDIFVRSPQQLDHNGLVFYCAVKNGMEVQLLRSTNIIEDTKRVLNEKLKNVINPAGLINFNCILRTIELYEMSQVDQYGAIFKDIPTVGFSTYGEQYRTHMNQTATMVLIY